MNNRDRPYLILYVLKHILLLEYIFILMISPHQLLCASLGLSSRACTTVPWCQDCSAAAFPPLFGNPWLHINFVIIRACEQCFQGPRIGHTLEVIVYVLKHYYKLNSMISVVVCRLGPFSPCLCCCPTVPWLPCGFRDCLAISVHLDHALAILWRSNKVHAFL